MGLVNDEVIEAYSKRFKLMQERGFTAAGKEEFLEKITVESRQVENLHVRCAIDGFKIDSDEPEHLGGSNKAARPMVQLLAALANCLQISAMLYFSFSGMHVDSVRVKVSSTHDKRFVINHPDAPDPGFHDITITWMVETGEPRSKVFKVIRKIEQNCPVKATFSRGHHFLSEIKIT
ncbi:hypothetical protein GF325_11655 [Candidatus Bathyarchaeota archaeon]|nr:hypothetical protein [Candidatus Bathyarchaeota archaeon]